MKIIFLDIDGVIDSVNSLEERVMEWYDVTSMDDAEKIADEKRKKDAFIPHFSMFYWPFDHKAVNLMHKIVRYNDDVQFVISSSWRVGNTIKELNEIFRYKGFQIPIIGFTKRIGARGIEIKDWLENNKEIQIESYCVIDDETQDIKPYIDNELIVTTHFKTGFTQTDYEKVIKILNLKIKEN